MKKKVNNDRFQSHLEPPGCLKEILLSPFNPKECIELALFQEHRFAFFYWLKWTNALKDEVPSLISYDWHQDLAPPYNDELDELKNLDVNNKDEVSLYSWRKLSRVNDVQIRAAVLHNKLKDVYAICRQQSSRPKMEIIKDFEGNEHKIFIFNSIEEFEAHLPKIKDKKVYFDIDLDYFTLSNPRSVKSPYSNKGYTYLKKKQINELLSLSNPTIRWIFERMVGFTIATEPEFCGGLKKSNYFLQIIDSAYFNPSLFYNSLGKCTTWKHLKT